MAGNPPAFPPAITATAAGDVYHGYDGMTLRDWFAGQALTGMGTWCPCRGDGYAPSGEDAVRQAKSEWAYKQADAMLEQRERGQ